MSVDYRRTLIAATVAQSLVVVHSEHDGKSCAIAGTPVRISKDHALIFVSKGTESSIPFASITSIDLIKPTEEVCRAYAADLRAAAESEVA